MKLIQSFIPISLLEVLLREKLLNFIFLLENSLKWKKYKKFIEFLKE